MNVSNAIAVIRAMAAVLFLVVLYLVGESTKDAKFTTIVALGCLAMMEIFGIQDIKRQAQEVKGQEVPGESPPSQPPASH